MRIGLATDGIGLDELALYAELSVAGHDVVHVDIPGSQPFTVPDVSVAINRQASKYGRQIISQIFEMNGIQMINPHRYELFSNNKLRIKMIFEKAGIPTAPFGYEFRFIFPSNSRGELKYEPQDGDAEFIGKAIEQKVGFPAVLKPTLGSRGKSLIPVYSAEDLSKKAESFFREYVEAGRRSLTAFALYRNLNNPSVTFFEKLIPHALDLRTVVRKLKGKPTEYVGCLARVGRSEEELAKNTALGSIPASVDPPAEVKELAVKSIDALIYHLVSSGMAKDYDSFYLIGGVDIIPTSDDTSSSKKIYEVIGRVSEYKDTSIEVAKRKSKGAVIRLVRNHGKNLSAIVHDQEFISALGVVDDAFRHFRELSQQNGVPQALREYLDKAQFLATEINSRVDYRFNTHNLATDQIPASYENIASSLA